MEKVFKLTNSNEKLVERILDNDEVMINHIILNKDDRMPIHNSNSNVYMVILKGTLSIKLNDNPLKKYENNTIVNIDPNITMDISNQENEQCEFLVVKAPSPRLYK